MFYKFCYKRLGEG